MKGSIDSGNSNPLLMAIAIFTVMLSLLVSLPVAHTSGLSFAGRVITSNSSTIPLTTSSKPTTAITTSTNTTTMLTTANTTTINKITPIVKSNTTTVANTTSSTVNSTTAATTIAFTSTISLQPFKLPAPNASSAFSNSGEVTLFYSNNFTCNANQTSAFNSSAIAQNASQITTCQIGESANASITQPLWQIVPAYAGMSVFGLTKFGSTPQGFAVYNGTPVLTNCGGGVSNASCLNFPPVVYSKIITQLEQSINASQRGWFGLPEGVLPSPAYSQIISNNSTDSYHVVTVLVFDPNIMPNPITGKCTQVVSSNLTNATGNCLTSATALQHALSTQSSDVATLNSNNPMYQIMVNNTGNITTQAVLASIAPSQPSPNTNIGLSFVVRNENFYYTTIPNATNTSVPFTSTTNQQIINSAPQPGNSGLAIVLYIIIIIIVVVAAWKFATRSKKSTGKQSQTKKK